MLEERGISKGKAAEMDHAICHEIRVDLEEYCNMVNDMRNTAQKGEEQGFTRFNPSI
ncbi:hypothetical protein ACN1JM_000354 [Bacillus pacificus]